MSQAMLRVTGLLSDLTEWMRGDEQVLDDAAADQMFLDDSFERGWIAFAIPRAFGVDDGDWAALTDFEAVGLRAQDAALIGQSQLGEATFQEVPRRHAAFHVTALGLGLLGAEKDVPPRDRNADSVRDVEQRIGHLLLSENRVAQRLRARNRPRLDSPFKQ